MPNTIANLDIKLLEREARQADVALEELPANEELVGSEPSPQFRKSVILFGVQTPITLVKTPTGYIVADGKRRIKAARLSDNPRIPARIIEGNAAEAALLTLLGNLMRKPNPVTEAEAIKQLVALQASTSDIARLSGVPTGTLKRLATLSTLNPILHAGVAAGKISQAVAAEAAKLPPQLQEKLARSFTDNGKVKATDVKSVKQARTNSALNQLPSNLFKNPDPTLLPQPTLEDACQCVCGKKRCASLRGF